MRAFAILLAAVLAAVGIGVGIEAANPPQSYGPPGRAVVVEAIAPMRAESLPEGGVDYLVEVARRAGTVEELVALGGSPRSPARRGPVNLACRRMPCGWVAYAPLAAGGHCVNGMRRGSFVESWPVAGGRGSILQSCTFELASAQVRSGDWQWRLTISGRLPLAQLEAILSSFGPAGS